MPVPHNEIYGKHVKPADRDPKLVFVGVPMTGSIRWETSQILAYLSHNEIAGYKFIVRKIGGFGLAKARNAMLWLARQTSASQVLWIDSDINAGPQQIERILSHDVDMVGGAYPKKQIPLTWVGEFNSDTPNSQGLLPAMSLGTGFLLHKMKVIDFIIAHFPEIAYYSDENSTPFEYKDVMHDVFSMGVVDDLWFGDKYPRYITEDYYLCYRWLKCGGSAWLDPLCQLGHIGTTDFLHLNGKLEDMKDQINKSNSDLQRALSKNPIAGQRDL